VDPTSTSPTRDRLIATALDLIWRSSYHATGVDQICRASGVKKGSFYHFFASKEDLAVAAIDTKWAEHKPEMDAVFSPTVEPLERLRRFLRLAVAEQERTLAECGVVCGCPLFSLGAEISTQQSSLRAKVDELLKIKLRYLESAIRDASAVGAIEVRDPGIKARIVMAYIEGVLTRARIMNDLGPLRECEAGVMDILGIRPPPARAPRGRIATGRRR
jgi:TetR/AcrR family transcriptional repressor of nem operon